MNHVTTRHATIEDLDVLATLFDGYRMFYRQPSNVAAARVFLRDRFEHGQSTILLAEHEGRAVGFTQLYPTFSSVSMQRMYVLNDLFVAMDGRRLGVGRALLDAAARFGRQMGAKELLLQTAIDNHAAQALYEAMGWTRDNAFYVYELSLSGGSIAGPT